MCFYISKNRFKSISILALLLFSDGIPNADASNKEKLREECQKFFLGVRSFDRSLGPYLDHVQNDFMQKLGFQNDGAQRQPEKSRSKETFEEKIHNVMPLLEKAEKLGKLKEQEKSKLCGPEGLKKTFEELGLAVGQNITANSNATLTPKIKEAINKKIVFTALEALGKEVFVDDFAHSDDDHLNILIKTLIKRIEE